MRLFLAMHVQYREATFSSQELYRHNTERRLFLAMNALCREVTVSSHESMQQRGECF